MAAAAVRGVCDSSGPPVAVRAAVESTADVPPTHVHRVHKRPGADAEKIFRGGRGLKK